MDLDWGRPAATMPYLIRHIGASDPPLRRVRRVGHMLARGSAFMASAPEVCEAGALLSERMGLDVSIRDGLWHVFERWDGKGIPGVVGGDDIVRPARFVPVAEVAESLTRRVGPDAAVEAIRARRGAAFDPAVVDAFLAEADRLLPMLDVDSVWDDVLAVEPGGAPELDDAALDEVLTAVADFGDLKSRFTLGHSRRVAELAEGAASATGLPPAEVAAVRRAGLVHDVGRAGIPTAIWAKPGALTRAEWERVRLHPYFTERAMSRPAALADVGRIASLDHERLDGSGYHRGGDGREQRGSARLLAAADVFQALQEPRPHRPAFSPDAARDVVHDEVKAGRLDAAAVDAVIGAATGKVRRRSVHVGGLTAREVEVLALAARGQSIKDIAAVLVVAPKTVDAHLQHIYTKLGVTTRAGATLYALQHGVVDETKDREITR
jgi:HD-GYP domain-containing protein (c-di-GMP phosphodiesterase class II)